MNHDFVMFESLQAVAISCGNYLLILGNLSVSVLAARCDPSQSMIPGILK